MPPPVNKIVLAIHGIGDQTRSSTVLATAAQCCHHFGYRALLPLGGFAGTLQDGRPPFVIPGPACPAGLATIGFGEIYWADLAREVETAGYTLQETKAWVRSVVSRIRVLAERRQPGRTDIHYGQIEYVMAEAIDAIGALEALLFLARKAGVLDFDLNRILTDYLGDVQLVTEFAPVRAGILGRLHETLANAHRLHPEAEIHLVAHSEGTVIAWLGLLEAASDARAFPWIRQVRGFMTIGSPIDKHLILWPGLFSGFTGPDPAFAAGTPPIRWLNYVDNGDPVGFELDTARWWLREHHYDQVFAFSSDDDYYFTRYAVPGKAHTDYWDDADVFQHFLMTVVAPPHGPGDPPPPARRVELANGPRQRWIAKFTSNIVAYLIPLGALLAGVYFLSKGVGHYLDPKGEGEHPHLIRNVLALGGLLAGTTVWLRLTQLVRFGRWHLGGALIYVACAALFYFAATPTSDLAWLAALPAQLGGTWADPRCGLLLASAALVAAVSLANARWLRRVISFMVPRLLPAPSPKTAAGPATAALAHPPLVRNALTVMLVLGGLALAANALVYDQLHHPAGAALWPIVLGAAAWLCLWRLAALVFDLVFIWHRYIRQSGALTFLRHAILPAAASQPPAAPAGKK